MAVIIASLFLMQLRFNDDHDVNDIDDGNGV